MHREKRFIPALRFPQLTHFYDAVARLTTREDAFRSALIEMAAIQPGELVVDLGCGTGSNAIEIKRRVHGVRVVGVDADPTILDIARQKAEAARLDVELHQAMASTLPFPDGAVDKIVSSLFFHHLNTRDKFQVLRECRRVLCLGGGLFVADWSTAQGLIAAMGFSLVRLLDGFEVTRDNAEGRLPELVEEAGFVRVKTVQTINSPAGTIALIKALRGKGHADDDQDVAATIQVPPSGTIVDS